MRISVNKRATNYLVKLTACFIIFIFLSFFVKIFVLGTIVCFLTSLCMIYFFRDPDLNKNKFKGIISPTDGKIVSIQKNTLGEQEIDIYSSLTDKYVKYSPIEGEIQNITVFSKNNKELQGGIEIEIVNKKYSIRILILNNKYISNREVESYVNVGDIVNQGDRICIVEFASSIRIYLKKEININYKKGDEIIAGDIFGE